MRKRFYFHLLFPDEKAEAHIAINSAKVTVVQEVAPVWVLSKFMHIPP